MDSEAATDTVFFGHPKSGIQFLHIKNPNIGCIIKPNAADTGTPQCFKEPIKAALQNRHVQTFNIDTVAYILKLMRTKMYIASHATTFKNLMSKKFYINMDSYRDLTNFPI